MYIIVIILFSLLGCRAKLKYYTKRTITTSIYMSDGTEKEVYKITEIRKKLIKR